MGDNFILGFMVLFLAALPGLFALWQHFKGKRILAAPFKTPGALAKDPSSPHPKGLISTEGALAIDAPLLSPITQTPCAYYQLLVFRQYEKHENGEKKSGTEPVTQESKGAEGTLSGDGGTLAVDFTKGADFDNIKETFDEKVKIGLRIPSELVFGSFRMKTPSLPDGDETVSFSATERIVPVDGNLYVLGKLEDGAIRKPGFRSMIVSSKGREGLLASTAKKKKIGGYAAAAVAVMSLFVMIFADNGRPEADRCYPLRDARPEFCVGLGSRAAGDQTTWTLSKGAAYRIDVAPSKGDGASRPVVTVMNEDGRALAISEEGKDGIVTLTTGRLPAGKYSLDVSDAAGAVDGDEYFKYRLTITEVPSQEPAPVVEKQPAAVKKTSSVAKNGKKKR